MIEKYFPEEDTILEDVKDNQISLTFICSNPDWDTNKQITLSDLGVARVYGMDMKAFSREAFVDEVKKLFPLRFNYYPIKDWEFPIPYEWKDDALLCIKTLKDNRLFNGITPSYTLDFEPPLYGLYLLKKIVEDYETNPNEEGKIVLPPSNFVDLLKHPGEFFKTEVFTGEINDD